MSREGINALWTRVLGIEITGNTLLLVRVGGANLALPYNNCTVNTFSTNVEKAVGILMLSSLGTWCKPRR